MKPLKPEKSCPLQNTHTRLHQLHRLWHQTQECYPNPEAFCTNLNAYIEALRSVTFLLQKEKRAIPDFDSWYAEWQARLKEDHLMRWFVDARNKIEKEGDLETCSTAKVSVLASWDGPQTIGEFAVNPLMPPDAIAEQFAKITFLIRLAKKEFLSLIDDGSFGICRNMSFSICSLTDMVSWQLWLLKLMNVSVLSCVRLPKKIMLSLSERAI